MTETTHLCHSEQETLEFAMTVASSLQGNEIFALIGDLGSGKTTFVKGLAKGLKCPSIVTSPTFNLVHRYKGERWILIHYDLYRLKRFEEIEALDLENELEERKIIAIEWPQLVKDILPLNRTWWVHCQETEEGTRKISMSLKR